MQTPVSVEYATLKYIYTFSPNFLETAMKANESCTLDLDYCDNNLVCTLCSQKGTISRRVCMSGIHYIILFVDLLVDHVGVSTSVRKKSPAVNLCMGLRSV